MKTERCARGAQQPQQQQQQQQQQQTGEKLSGLGLVFPSGPRCYNVRSTGANSSCAAMPAGSSSIFN
jgi:hypothetical protein